MENQKNTKKLERGYLVVTGIFLVLLGTVAYACIYAYKVTQLNYHIAILNNELALQGIYIQINQVIPDYSVFNWAITAESSAFAITAAAQASKKKMNNVYQYAEEWLDKWITDPETRPFIMQVVQSFIMANQNNS